MIDLGCGDFRIGSQLVDVCQSYMACDASPHIIDLNRKKYSNLDVDFKVLDIANSAIPDGEVVLIRQVLQHLSNEQISRFVNQINNNDKMKVLLVTEHLPFHNFKPNINKPVGHSIRILRNSGVVLHERPFNLKCKKMNVLLTLEKSSAGKEGVIQTTEYLF